MTRKANSIFRAIFIGSLVMFGGLTPIANAAGGGWGDQTRHRHSDTCGCERPTYAGKISIDGCSTRIRSDRSIPHQVARAFRQAGYQAWVDAGLVRVDYGRCRPSVRWYRDGYSARLSWDCGELAVSIRRQYRGAIRGHHRGHRPVRRSPKRVIRWGICD